MIYFQIKKIFEKLFKKVFTFKTKCDIIYIDTGNGILHIFKGDTLMKNYSIGLHFAKYDLDEVVNVNCLEEIRPIAENITYRMEPKKTDCSSVRVRVDVYVLAKHGNDYDGFPINHCQIYVHPCFHAQYINNKTGELIANSREKFKNFFMLLFKHHTFSTYKCLEPDKAPLIGKR